MVKLSPEELDVPPIIFPQLQHLFLSHCVIEWNYLFTTEDDARHDPPPPSPILVMPHLRTANFYRCEGLPGSEVEAAPPKKKKASTPKRIPWLDKLREMCPSVDGCGDGRKGYLGSGDW